MNVLTPTLYDIAYVCRHAMPDEVAQWAALGMTPDETARRIAGLPGVSFAAISDDGTPLAAGGFTETRSNVWESWMVSTPDAWSLNGREISEECRIVCDNLLASERCHRIEIIALESRRRARVWYERVLGAKLEQVAEKWFPDGSNAAIYSKVK